MSKRKNGQEIINVPQPKWPELAYFDSGVMRRVVPVVDRNGLATYDVSKMDAKAAVVVDELVTKKVSAGDLLRLTVKQKASK